MEEERYTIESFEIDEPSCIFDNKTQQRILSLVEYNYDEITNLKNLLNQQDARIEELEEQLSTATMYHGCDILVNELKQENQQLKEDLQAKDILVNTYMSIVGTLDNAKQLKQSQNQKAIEELEKVKEWIKSVDESGYIFPFRDMDTREKFNQKLDNQINELRGKNE